MFTSWCPSASVQRPNIERHRVKAFRCSDYVASRLHVWRWRERLIAKTGARRVSLQAARAIADNRAKMGND